MRISDWSSDVCSSDLIVECPAHATIKGLAETLLTALGDPKPWRGSQQEMTQRVLYGLRLRRVSLIVLDEFQHLSNQVRSNYAAYETADRKSVVLGKECVSKCRSRWSPYH